ncbi:MAG: NUDIX domain-containing protein [Paludibacter sp.]|nr:NUDIX domain-containing protein [Paludibacter sp.]
MKRLRKQIQESFFNPILHFLPLIVFLVVDDFWGTKIAWLSSLPVATILFIYIFCAYRKIFEWFSISTGIYFFVALSVSFLPVEKLPVHIRDVAFEYLLLIVFVVSLVFRKKIEAIVYKRNLKQISMSNNLNEMFRMIWILGGVIFVYVHVYTFLIIFDIPHLEVSLHFLHSSYLLVLLFVVIYELVRVTVVRVRLLKEEWWPIVNDQGKMIGSIQQMVSLTDPKKFMHPIIRIVLIDGNRIYLQKKEQNSAVYPGMWDAAISNHVRMNETIEKCINRTAYELYGLQHLKPLFLSNYVHETEQEFHYAFLFVVCNLPELKPNPKYIEHAKWWTLKQIEDNADERIFTENLLIEIDLIKRSGLLESEHCECDCKLKNTINDISENERMR